MQRYKITIEYDGTDFCGWQRQNGQLSVQQVLEEAFIPLSREPVDICGSGRTDAGVHALGQVAHADLLVKIDVAKIKSCLQYYVKPYPISILSVEEVNDQFHARFSAIQRHYVYKILNRKSPPAIANNRVLWISGDLNDQNMNEAAQCLIGKHDFSTFRDSRCQSNSPIKTLNSVSVIRTADDLIEITCTARSFLHHQVRNIVGTLCNVGNSKWSIEEFVQAFMAKDRTKGGITAPASGLYLLKVDY